MDLTQEQLNTLLRPEEQGTPCEKLSEERKPIVDMQAELVYGNEEAQAALQEEDPSGDH